jgi:hypothetical protein
LTFDEQLTEETQAVSEFLAFYSVGRDLSRIIYSDWTARDVLSHVASWHMSFARNLLDAVNHIKPSPFKGSLTEVNEREVKSLSQFSVVNLIQKIKHAQEQIEQNIGNQGIIGIAYKKGSRDYSPIEHLEVVRRHIRSHLADLEGKYRE